MSTLVEWLRQQLDDDEQQAQAAQDGDGYAVWDNPSTGVVQVAAGDAEGLALATRNAAIHIATHDPARALRQVAAYRAILDYALGHMAAIDGEWGCCHSAEQIERGLCEEESPDADEAIRAIAAIYSDRPGYTEAIGGTA